jgi:hypothetical protein
MASRSSTGARISRASTRSVRPSGDDGSLSGAPGDPGWGPDEAVSPQGVMELAVPGGLRPGMMMEWKAGEG